MTWTDSAVFIHAAEALLLQCCHPLVKTNVTNKAKPEITGASTCR